MAATIVLTPRPDDAAVTVAVSGAGATVTLYRTDAAGVRSVVRGSPFPTQAGAVTVVDYEAPFGFVRYALDEQGTAAVATSLDVTSPWLTNPLAQSFLSIPVAVIDDDDWASPARAYLFDVIDRADPVVTWYRRATRSGVLRLRYSTVAERSSIAQAVLDGAPVLIRYPATDCGRAFLTAYLAVEDARVTPDHPGATAGVYELAYRVCAAPPGAPAGGEWTWADVPAEAATWAALQAEFRTWRDVVAFDRTVGPTRAAAVFGT